MTSQKKKKKKTKEESCMRGRNPWKKNNPHFEKLNLQQKEGGSVETKEADRELSQG